MAQNSYCTSCSGDAKSSFLVYSATRDMTTALVWTYLDAKLKSQVVTRTDGPDVLLKAGTSYNRTDILSGRRSGGALTEPLGLRSLLAGRARARTAPFLFVCCCCIFKSVKLAILVTNRRLTPLYYQETNWLKFDHCSQSWLQTNAD